jgi:hypothetical protein
LKTPKADYDAKVLEVNAAKLVWDAALILSTEGKKTLDAQSAVVGATVDVDGKKKDKKTADDLLAAYVSPGALKVAQDDFQTKGKAIGDAWKAVLVTEAADTYTGADDLFCEGTGTAENYSVVAGDTVYDKDTCKPLCTAKDYYSTTASHTTLADGDYCYGYEIAAGKCRLYKKILAAKDDDGGAGGGCYQRDSSKQAMDVFITNNLDGAFAGAVTEYSATITSAWEALIDGAEVGRADLNMETAIETYLKDEYMDKAETGL